MKKILNKKIIILVLILAVMTVVSGCGKKEVKPVINDDKQSIKQEQNNEKVEDEKKEEIIISTDKIDISDWQTYYNKEYGFEVKYPEGWEFQEYKLGTKSTTVSFGTPESYRGGHLCGIRFRHKPKDLEKVIALVGNQFFDRKEERKNIKFNNIDGLLVTISTKELENWVSESIYISKNNILFEIGNYEIKKDGKVKQFYKSFKFIN